MDENTNILALLAPDQDADEALADLISELCAGEIASAAESALRLRDALCCWDMKGGDCTPSSFIQGLHDAIASLDT